MANILLTVFLILLLLAIAGPLFLGAIEGALRIFLWIALIVVVLGLVGSLVRGSRPHARY